MFLCQLSLGFSKNLKSSNAMGTINFSMNAKMSCVVELFDNLNMIPKRYEPSSIKTIYEYENLHILEKTVCKKFLEIHINDFTKLYDLLG
jgi:hypothetical protein